MDMRFEWGQAKSASNVRKHGVSFEMAALAFADPFALTAQDRIEGGEYRWQTLGMVQGVLLLLVAHTIRDDAETEVIRIISARPATRPRGDVMSRKTISLMLDADDLPPLTDAQRAELERLAAQPDAAIDTSDIPPLDEAFWTNARRFGDRALYRPVKQSTTVRLDADVVAWLKAKGKGYQTRLNAILREAMMREVG